MYNSLNFSLTSSLINPSVEYFTCLVMYIPPNTELCKWLAGNVSTVDHREHYSHNSPTVYSNGVIIVASSWESCCAEIAPWSNRRLSLRPIRCPPPSTRSWGPMRPVQSASGGFKVRVKRRKRTQSQSLIINGNRKGSLGLTHKQTKWEIITQYNKILHSNLLQDSVQDS